MTDDLALRTTLAELGGVARTAQLRRSVSARVIRDAVLAGTVVQLGRGRYAAAGVADDLQRAHQVSAVVSHLSAAAHHGWSTKHPPARPQVTLRPGAHPSVSAQRGIRAFWRAIPAESIVDGVTEPYRTVLDCARDLPFDQSLAVADSALRCGDVDRGELRQLAAASTGPGARAVRRLAQECEVGAANPLESVLRAICCDVPGLRVDTQVQIADPWARVDLCDARLQLVIEAEGFETHATRDGFDKDCARYTALACHGYLVLRFTYAQVMRNPDWVTDQLAAAVALCQIRQSVPSGRRVSRKPVGSGR